MTGAVVALLLGCLVWQIVSHGSDTQWSALWASSYPGAANFLFVVGIVSIGILLEAYLRQPGSRGEGGRKHIVLASTLILFVGANATPVPWTCSCSCWTGRPCEHVLPYSYGFPGQLATVERKLRPDGSVIPSRRFHAQGIAPIVGLALLLWLAGFLCLDLYERPIPLPTAQRWAGVTLSGVLVLLATGGLWFFGALFDSRYPWDNRNSNRLILWVFGLCVVLLTIGAAGLLRKGKLNAAHGS